MVIFETEVSEIIQRTYNVKSFRFKKKQDVGFKAGQFFFLGIMINGAERTKHFSFSNSPTEEGYIEFTKKLTDSEFSKALDRLKVGDWAKIKMPYGSFTFESGHKKIAFLSGGIGITPIRSICKYVVDKKLDADIALLYGNRTSKDIVFKDDFGVMQSGYRNLKVLHILSQADSDWTGKKGHIDNRLIKEEIPDYAERRFYICGPPSMVEVTKKILLEDLNLSTEQIITENFTGY